MTPTYLGRIQTRAFLLLTGGLVITFFYALLGALAAGPAGFVIPFVILFFVLFAGLVWDAIYILIQRLRWDRDWPIAFQFATGFFEMFPALFLYIILVLLAGNLTFGLLLLFLFHYWTVWWMVYIASQGPMRIFFHRWRFRGGRLI